MANVFNVNQNRQFFVVTSAPTTGNTAPTEEGGLNILKVPVNPKGSTVEQVTFQHFGKGGLVRTDLIDLEKVCYANITEPGDLDIPLKKAVVKLDENVNEGKLVKGQDYVLRIQINNYLAPGDASVYIKTAAVHANGIMTEEDFYKKMAEVFTKSFSREEQTMLKFEGSAEGLTITEIDDSPYRRGVLSKEGTNFEVYPSTITYDTEEVVWAKVDEKTNRVELEPSGDKISGTYKLADLEYFCSAERGDMFRNMGYPNNIDVQMMVDLSKEYYVLDVHYYFSGPGVQNHKSEKEITFVATTKDWLETIKNAVMPD